MASSKRAPSVLVTDARERPSSRVGAPRPGTAGGAHSRISSTRGISVDNVLQYASEIPSGQPRVPPGQRPPRVRRGSLGGGLPNLASVRTGQQNVPSRTTKISEKLVLLPETVDEKDDDTPTDEDAARQAEFAQRRLDDENRPLKDEELDVLRKRGGIRGKSYAERLPKVQRGEKLARVTAYCTAQAYKMRATAEFLRTKHEAKTKLYDDCLYTVYHLPLLPGIDGYRIRSRPMLKTPGSGKTVLDLEIERSERRDEHEGYFDDYVDAERNADGSPSGLAPLQLTDNTNNSDQDRERGRSADRSRDEDAGSLSPVNRLAPDAKSFAEMFVYSYGVVVFWNFTEHQEKDILADLTFADNETTTGPPLVQRPLDQSDFETEQFHFEYSAGVKRPRVFNDMITLLPRSDHMVKLTISHAIAQSTKLCFFEERMSETMLEAQHVPKRLALTGELNMTRTEIVKMWGRLFESRVDINLSSNILDVPNFFWESEPTLHPLYVAIRDYLEIDLRIKVLNERRRVFLDLAEILSDSVADAKSSAITWIIIALIVVSIIMTVTEVSLRFLILEKEKGGRAPRDPGDGTEVCPPCTEVTASSLSPAGALDVQRVLREGRTGRLNLTLDDWRLLSDMLTEREKAAVCGAEYVGVTFAGV